MENDLVCQLNFDNIEFWPQNIGNGVIVSFHLPFTP